MPRSDSPGTLIQYQDEISGLATGGSSVYWTSGAGNGYAATCPPCDASPPMVVSVGLASPRGLALFDGVLYLTTGTDAAGKVLAVPAAASVDAGPPLATLSSDQMSPFAVAADSRYVFFTTRGTPGESDAP